MTLPMGERLATVEQAMKDQGKKLDEISTDIKDIKNVLQVQSTLREEIIVLKQKIDKIESSRGFWQWASPTLSAIISTVCTSLITILVLSYLDKLK